MTASISSDARLLALVAPGMTHALGNQLFAIRTAGLLLGRDGASTVASETLREALDHAESSLAVWRLLCESGVGPRPEPVGSLLGTLAGLCRVPLRDHGLRLSVDESSRTCEVPVESGGFVRAVLTVLLALLDELDGDSAGELGLGIPPQDGAQLSLELVLDRGGHPIADAVAVAARAEASLTALDAKVTAERAATLRLSLRPA